MSTERTPLIPIGMIPLANLARDHGFEVEVIHYGLDQSNLDADMLFFSLHWHDQSTVVIDKILELGNPNTFVGGHMASCFKEEIEKNYPIRVIAGQAEQELVEILTGKKIYIDINQLDYSSFDVMRSYDRYLENGFHFTTGRGCPVNCTYCSGCKVMQLKIYERKRYEFLKHDKVINELKNAMNYGAKEWFVSFDPKPKGDYYLKLFDMIDFDIKIRFDCWGLPTKEFIDKFMGTLTLSPKTCLDDVRKKHKGMYYSNNELVEIIEYIDMKGNINVKLFFTEMEDKDLINKLGENRCYRSIMLKEPYEIDSFKKYYHIHKLGITDAIRIRLS